MKAARVYKFLAKRKKKKPWNFADAPDPRQQGKVAHPIHHIYDALWLGLLAGKQTLRDVEEMVDDDSGGWAKRLVGKRISDTTLDTEARRLSESYLQEKLTGQVRDMYRSKMLHPVGLPCGVVTVDGKNLATLDHDAGGRAQPRSRDNEKWHSAERSQTGGEYFLAPALRAVLTSAEAKPAIAQVVLGPHEGEATAFGTMVQLLHQAYGRSGMIDVIDADAGLTSLANANLVDQLGYGYVFGLKGNQPELFAEAKALLEPMAATQPPEGETAWQPRNGKSMRRRLWRTGEMQGMENSVGRWTHLRQTWLVRQETKNPDGTQIEVEDRYFVTSILWNYLKPNQILLLVRNHWGIENDCYNTLDLQWREDSGPWCTKGNAVYGLGLLRLMAYNLAQYLRKRRLRRKVPGGFLLPPVSWRSIFNTICQALEYTAFEPLTVSPGV